MFHVKHPVVTDLTHLRFPLQLGCRIVQASSPVSRLTDLRKGLLTVHSRPDESPMGVGLALVSLVVMPILAARKNSGGSQP